MLICPNFFDGRFDGIGRVSGAFHEGLGKINGRPPFVLSANDPAAAWGAGEGRCYAQHYYRMMWDAVCGSPRGLPPPVVIVCTHLGLSPVARFQARRRNAPYVVFIHGVECWRRLPARDRWGLQRAAAIFANSEYTRRVFLEFNPWSAGIRNRVISLGVAPGIGDDWAPREHPRLCEEVVVLAVGRISGAAYYQKYRAPDDIYKGFKNLILAVGLAAKRVPRLRLAIVGDGDARPELEAWLGGRPERERVSLLGRVSDAELQELYATSDVFALASEGEGFGIAFAEAMAYGLPCVCVRAGAAPEVVQDGVTGLVAEPRNVEDLAAKLLRLASDHVFRARLGTYARRRFEERYSTKAFQARIIDAMQEVIGSSVR